MLKELLSAKAWNKTSHFIHEKYGKKIEFKFLTLAQSTSHFYAKGDDLIIPLHSRQQHLGDIIVHRGSTLSPEAKNEIADLIQFLVQPQVYNLHLKIQEKESSERHFSENNIISLFGTRETEQEFDRHQNFEDNTSEGRKTLSALIHLKSKSEVLRHKVALKIHEMNGSAFFVRLSDISSSVHTLEDIETLKGATIYVDDVKTLNRQQLQLIEDFCKSDRQNDILILMASDLSEKELLALDIGQNLKNDLSSFLFDIDRVPLSQQTNEEVLDLLFFQFSENPS